MGVGPVRLGHPFHVLLLLHRPALTFGGVHQLVGDAHRRAPLGALVGRLNEPPQGQGLLAPRGDLHGDLVVGPAHAAGTDLHPGLDVLHRLLEDLEGLLAGLLLDDILDEMATKWQTLAKD